MSNFICQMAEIFVALNVSYYKCDITNFQSLNAVSAAIHRFVCETLCLSYIIADRLHREVGYPSCVVACAGICRAKPILLATPQDIDL
jgi:all-trans-retinol dehydrogenase (NAD+)